MVNYNEKVNYGTEEEPLLRERLTVMSTMYGFNLYDRKTKNSLILRKTREDCEIAMGFLRASNIDGFNSFKDEIKTKEISENKIIVFKEKHGKIYYSINTFEQLKRVSLKVLKERIIDGSISKWDEPESLDYDFAGIEEMPFSFRYEATRKLQSYKGSVKEVEENNNLYDSAVKAVEEENGSIAWIILQNRCDYQHEEFEVIDVINL